MKVLINQIILEMKLFFRDPVSVFWTFFFPALLMILIGWFFKDDVSKVILYIYDQDKSINSKQFIDELNNSHSLKVNLLSKKTFHLKIKDNRGELILMIHKGFQEKISKKKSSNMTLYYNMAFGSGSDVGISMFYQLLPKMSQKITNISFPFNIQKVNLGQQKGKKTLGYIDFLVPGLIAMAVMSTCLFGVGIVITSYREKGKLRRLALTPLRKSIFIMAHIIQRYFVVLLQSVILIGLAILFFDLKIYGDFISLIVVITVGLLTFISIGFMVASRAKKSETAAAIANVIFFPMLLLGGVYFSIDNIPEVVRPVVDLLPLSHLTEALRQVLNYGEPFYKLVNHLFAQFVVMILCFIVSIKAFRWE